MNKIASLALLVGGFVLIIIGFNATHFFNSDASRFITGTSTNQAVWMVIGGSIAAVAGLAMMWRSPKHTPNTAGQPGQKRFYRASVSRRA